MTGQAFIFINYKQAAKFGHIGWGFLVAKDRYLFGSTDHLMSHDWWNLPGWLRYMDVPVDGHTDWWLSEGSRDEMLRVMKAGHHIRYHHYKCLPVESADPVKAEATARQTGVMGWSVLDNNCVHQTYQILSAYGGNTLVPDPASTVLARIPRLWFDLLDGELGVLRDPSTPGL